MLLGRLLVAVALLASAACSPGKDAAGPSDTFEFVSPGGQTRLFYEAGQRKRVAGLAGPDVLDPGRQVALGDYAGKVVLVNLWGAWCGPCRAEAHVLQDISVRGRSEGVEVLGVNVRDNREYAADFVRNFGLGYRSIFDDSGRIALRLRGLPLAAVPISLIVDRQQRVAAVYLGEVLEEDLRPALDRVRAE